jgi:hypothetical protein
MSVYCGQCDQSFPFAANVIELTERIDSTSSIWSARVLCPDCDSVFDVSDVPALAYRAARPLLLACVVEWQVTARSRFELAAKRVVAEAERLIGGR